MAAPPATYPLPTIAKLFDLSERRVQQLSKEGVIPKAARGRYELAPAVQGYVRYLRARTLTRDVEDGDGYAASKARLTRANADLAELDLAQKRADQVLMTDVTAELTPRLERIRTKLMNAPGKYATRWQVCKDYGEAQLILEEITRDVLADVRSAFVDDGNDCPKGKRAKRPTRQARKRKP